ncbi:MAG: ABC transporter ATP-binding protein, partial [Verrucomicrobia bacterium]
MLTVSGLCKAYAGRTLFANASFTVDRGDRIGLVGPNGAGKSTLFSLILGREEPDAGRVEFRRGIRVGHLPQETVAVGEETVMQLATLPGALTTGTDTPPAPSAGEEVYDREARAARILAGLGFRQSDFHRPVRTLSGGWIMRAHLARLLVQEPDLLLLDEPTNHLDLQSVLWFQNYLKTYPGALLAISHDRAFLNELMDSIIEIRQGRLWRYRGNYDAFLAQREADAAHHLAAWKNQQRQIARLQAFV